MQTQDVTANPGEATGKEKDLRNNPIVTSATNIDSGGDSPPAGNPPPPHNDPPGVGDSERQ